MTNQNNNTKSLSLALSGSDFLSKKFKPRSPIIDPFFMTQGLMMIYAQRGIGKTYFAMTLASAMASSSNLFEDRFRISKKWKVLYIDGEMSGYDMQERLKSFNLSQDNLQNITIINPDMQEPLGQSPNIASEEGQDFIEPHVSQSDVIIVDNISTLVRQSSSENQSNSWDSVQHWALRLRSQGKSVIFIHHASKSGSQRGTSKREDVLDTVITLKRPNGYKPSQGARFEVHFEKSRGFAGDEAEGFELSLDTSSGEASWIVNSLNDDKTQLMELIKKLNDEGLNHRAIAKELNISESKAYRILKEIVGY